MEEKVKYYSRMLKVRFQQGEDATYMWSMIRRQRCEPERDNAR
mgnify:CR=1 FL=1